ncbi:MAG: nitroreductase family protein [Rikenellaceae bacterium]|nr:nitroreductase family protein [Rikenellaceae bacterium]
MKTLLLAFAALAMSACCCNQNAPEVEPLAATPIEFAAEIVLPAPDLTRGVSISEALQNRRSWREYSPEQLSMEELSGVLWAAAGINRPENDHLTAPSAMALYPIRVYAVFEAGIYRYEAKGHKLVRVVEGDQRAVAGTQPFVVTAPLNLIYVADLSTYAERPIPREKVKYLCGQDAAGYAENVNLYTAGTGLRSITRGNASPNALEVLGLEAEQYFVALAQSVGK